VYKLNYHCRCEIAGALLDSGADTLAYAVGSHSFSSTRWKNLLISSCVLTEDNYLKVQTCSLKPYPLSAMKDSNLEEPNIVLTGFASKGQSCGLCFIVINRRM
jgi:hypothetical protein